MMYIHGNNETDKTINDNSTAAGCNSRLMIIHILGLLVVSQYEYLYSIRIMKSVSFKNLVLFIKVMLCERLRS